METTQIARLVGVIALPLSVDEVVAHMEDLVRAHGKDIVVRTDLGRMLVYTPGAVCGCRACIGADQEFLNSVGERLGFVGMVVCPECGSKRCPRAGSHEVACERAA